MGKALSRTVKAGGVGGVVVIAAAQTKPEDAISNLAGWLKVVGVEDVPSFLNSVQTDAWATAIGVLLIAVAALLWAWRRWRDKPPQSEAELLDAQTRAAREQRLNKRQEHRLASGTSGSIAHILEEVEADRKAEAEARRQRMIREAGEPPRPTTFNEAWRENVSDQIPFVRLRDLAPGYGFNLDPHDPNSGNVAYGIERALRQAAVDGEVSVRGRKHRGPIRDNDPLVSIPVSHFEDYTFKHGCLHYEEKNDKSATASPLTGDGQLPVEGVTYYDLHLSLEGAKAVLRKMKDDE